MSHQPPTTERYYLCARCDNVYCTDWPEQNAIAEYDATFPNSHNDKKITLCADCYLVFLRWFKTTEH